MPVSQPVSASNGNNKPLSEPLSNPPGTQVVFGPKSLKVTNTPGKNLVTTNYAYVNEKEFPEFPIYIKVRDIVLIAQSHSAIELGSIALNKIQRQSAHLPNNADADCDIFRVPKQSFELSLVTMEIDFISPNTVTDPEVDGKRLIQTLKECYNRHIFVDRQKFVIDFEGNMILVVIKDLEVFDTKTLETNSGELKEMANMGMLTKNTTIRVMKTKSSSIRLTNIPSESTTTTDIFNTAVTFEKLGIGGLDKQLNNIFRRAFASRIYPPDVIKKLGVKHVKGIILYGPPGTGKTLVARQIGKILNCKEPKIINGPEILNKYVGQSEENIRKLFADAESEYNEKGDDSQLHLLIFDELDAICKQRGTVRDGTGVQDSIVNQLLSKIDGVNSLNNILIIGMTNRLDMLDEALLRPGRFEVQMEIGLPDETGRLQILKIHTREMSKNQYLSEDINFEYLAKTTKNFSGAEIEGLVKSAASFALNRQIDINGKKKFDEKNIKVTAGDFEMALTEVKPAFGVSTDELEAYLNQGLINYGEPFSKLMNTCKSFIKQVETSNRTNLLSMLLSGATGSGKTTIAAHLAVESGFPYVKIISADRMVGYSEQTICTQINKIFHDAYKSPFSIIVLDSIERLIQLVHIGPRFSNLILQALLVLIKKPPPSGRKLLVIGTTSMADILENLEITKIFNVTLEVPSLSAKSDIMNIFLSSGCFSIDSTIDKETMKTIIELVPKNIPIKKLLLVTEMAYTRTDMDDSDSNDESQRRVTFDKFYQSLKDCGVFPSIKKASSGAGFIMKEEEEEEEEM
ncbi:hypothetical protein C9374_012557 [Naegleria lovaniensis]|uniref:Vesicle-fusing ATPase n=1 Tax=Naegleria lovaniensis TaxID=51637 RepID=A0AA88KW42_NAELO|nr:uncharacterized protein C9374_012557 [Naegleria lovaniensis]KAG2392305.1 hypothetical protein C9374_012557 [Naegleria lovaniensis]